MAEAGLNDPSSYYAGDPRPSLGWEMTVCQSLADAGGACAQTLRRPRPYGEVLAEYLAAHGGLGPATRLVEVGGGEGTLMAALLGVVPVGDVTLVDVSPFFLGAQRRALEERPGVRYVLSDAVAFARSLERDVDLLIANENIGDLPTATDVPRRAVWPPRDAAGSDPVARTARAVRRYGLDLSDAPEAFPFNLGAVEFLEALAPRCRAVFLSEHSCDAVVPPPWDAVVSAPPSNGYPRRVPLRGHDEYTIRFDHLERVARGLGYRVSRLHLAELLDLRTDPEVRSMVRAPNTLSERAEVVHEFYHHVAEYQCLLLTR